MQTSRKINFVGACLGLVTFGLGVYNPLDNQNSYTCPAVETIGGQLCRGQVPQPLSEHAWAQVGAVAYQAAAQLMISNNGEPESLDDTQKKYLRPYFGDLVDRVEVIYNATLMEDWVAASFKINVGESNAQVYGHKIYIKKPYKEGDLEQLVLLAHELIHCKQYEELGSLGKFGYHYFKEYKRAGESYKGNKFEQEAFAFEAEFGKKVAKEMKKKYSPQHHQH